MRKHSEDLRPRPIAPDQAADRGHPNQSSDHYQRIAFVQSRWHKDLVDQSRTAFIAEMAIVAAGLGRRWRPILLGR